MHTSVFHLCPRGNGPSSYRLYEALQADTIPIYIWDEVHFNLLSLKPKCGPSTTACTRRCRRTPSPSTSGTRCGDVKGTRTLA
jgi:hypothetical protein